MMANLFFLIFIYASASLFITCLSNEFSILSHHDNLQNYTSEEQLYGLFLLWQKQHQRMYPTPQEEAKRFQIFQANLKHINHINANRKYPSESRLGLNKFADLSPQEFSKIYLHNVNTPSSNTLNFKKIHDDDDPCDVPDSLDWRQKDAVTQVKDQGNCESHWAFSVVAAIEGINAIKTGNLIELSAQNLVDCDPASKGCDGGYYFNAFGWVIDNGGIDTSADYPYTGEKGTCKINATKAVSISNLYVVDGTENGVLCTVGQQPVTTSVDAVDLQLYSHGIYRGDNCGKNSTKTTLVVAIVGYGTENGEDYWIVKNTWGKDWGEDGYVRILRNAGWPYGVCGINYLVGYPTQDSSSSASASTSEQSRASN